MMGDETVLLFDDLEIGALSKALEFSVEHDEEIVRELRSRQNMSQEEGR